MFGLGKSKEMLWFKKNNFQCRFLGFKFTFLLCTFYFKANRPFNIREAIPVVLIILLHPSIAIWFFLPTPRDELQ